jgi:hypothetical protein
MVLPFEEDEKSHCECNSHVGELLNVNVYENYQKRMSVYFEKNKRKISKPINIVQKKKKK